MTAAATRDDLLSVITALTGSAVQQRQWQADYLAKADDARSRANARRAAGEPATRDEELMWDGFAREAKGSAFAFEVCVNTLTQYVGRPPFISEGSR